MEDDGKTRIIRRGDVTPPTVVGSEATQYINTTIPSSNNATQCINTLNVGAGTDAPTRVIPMPQNGIQLNNIPLTNATNKTTIFRSNANPDTEKNWDPVVGWVIITKGKGVGKSFELGQGNNSIGKNSTNKVSLDFGDETISREEHLKIVFDPIHVKFWAVQNGNSRNLAYLNKAPILMPTELKPYDCISLGSTEFKFIPFCGEKHSWEDPNDNK